MQNLIENANLNLINLDETTKRFGGNNSAARGSAAGARADEANSFSKIFQNQQNRENELKQGAQPKEAAKTAPKSTGKTNIKANNFEAREPEKQAVKTTEEKSEKSVPVAEVAKTKEVEAATKDINDIKDTNDKKSTGSTENVPKDEQPVKVSDVTDTKKAENVQQNETPETPVAKAISETAEVAEVCVEAEPDVVTPIVSAQPNVESKSNSPLTPLETDKTGQEDLSLNLEVPNTQIAQGVQTPTVETATNKQTETQTTRQTGENPQLRVDENRIVNGLTENKSPGGQKLNVDTDQDVKVDIKSDTKADAKAADTLMPTEELGEISATDILEQAILDELNVEVEQVIVPTTGTTVSTAGSAAEQVIKMQIEKTATLEAAQNADKGADTGQGGAQSGTQNGANGGQGGALNAHNPDISPTTGSTATTTAAQSAALKFSDVTKSDILNQIGAKFEQLQLKEGGAQNARITLALRPHDLGRVVIELSQGKDGITTNILAQNQDVKEILEKNIEGLKQQLAQAGVNVQNINVRVIGNPDTENAEEGGENFREQNESEQGNSKDKKDTDDTDENS